MIAVIPARGGSKGLPGKNIKMLAGKPLIAYTIEAALKSGLFTNVVVSTDDEDIKEIALTYGAEVPFLRPPHLAQDDSMAVDAYLFTIDEMEKIVNRSIDEIAVLLPTSPLRTEEDIINAYELFKVKNADSVISYTQEHHPISWHRYMDEDGKLTPIFADTLGNRQDFKISYFPNGSIYIFKTEVLRKKIYYTDHSYGFVMPRNRSVDIDVQDDFDLAEYYLKKQNGL